MARSRVNKLPASGPASKNLAVPKGAMGKPKNKQEALEKLDKIGGGVVARGKASVRASNKSMGKPANTGISPTARAAGSTSKLMRNAKKGLR